MEWYSTVLRRAEVKEHFKFVILRDNKLRNGEIALEGMIVSFAL